MAYDRTLPPPFEWRGNKGAKVSHVAQRGQMRAVCGRKVEGKEPFTGYICSECRRRILALDEVVGAVFPKRSYKNHEPTLYDLFGPATDHDS